LVVVAGAEALGGVAVVAAFEVFLELIRNKKRV